jgi:hypothetical protein
MRNENILIDFIQKEIIREEKNYDCALSTGKSIAELKKIQDRIDYLKEIYRKIEGRYENSQQGDLSISD